MHNKTILILVAGGTASGKTTVAKSIKDIIPKSLKSALICLDSFYRKDLGNIVQNKNHTNINFDHPNSIDWPLLRQTMKEIVNQNPVNINQYDYVHSRMGSKSKLIKRVDVIILEGILALYDEDLNNMAKLKVFVDTPDDERFIRRFLRDKAERGRSEEIIIQQWKTVVKPMHRQFIAPQKASADIIIPWYTVNDVAIKAIKGSIKELIKD